MTRAELEQEYTVVDGRITDPGKFEGEPLYVPYFWDCYLEGGADDDDGDVLTFEIHDTDVEIWPELSDAYKVCLQETEQGFVYCEVYRRTRK